MVRLPAAFSLLLLSSVAHADDKPAGILDSVYLGIAAHEIVNDEEGGADVNLELRTLPLFQSDWGLKVLPTLGATINVGDDTDTAYIGATMQYDITPSFFIEGFFGFAAHNADTPTDVDGLDLGCTVLFREAAGIGYRHEKHSIALQISHASHGDILCKDEVNDGMTSLGLRYGYSF